MLKVSLVFAGNLASDEAELINGIMVERGRGFASDKEAWAELKENIETGKKMVGDSEKIHKDMWEAVKENDPDAFGVFTSEIERNAMQQAAVWLTVASLARISYLKLEPAESEE